MLALVLSGGQALGLRGLGRSRRGCINGSHVPDRARTGDVCPSQREGPVHGALEDLVELRGRGGETHPGRVGLLEPKSTWLRVLFRRESKYTQS